MVYLRFAYLYFVCAIHCDLRNFYFLSLILLYILSGVPILASALFTLMYDGSLVDCVCTRRIFSEYAIKSQPFVNRHMSSLLLVDVELPHVHYVSLVSFVNLKPTAY